MVEVGPVRADSDAAKEWPTFTAVSLTGSISVCTTEQGLPVGIKVDRAELQRDLRQLSGEILRLCQRSANRAGLARRAQLVEAGISPATLAMTGLPTKGAVARQEVLEEQDYETEPVSWLRSV
ncbi:hypothetical protein ACQP1G_17165 [Nocardia sp. CA-107356]|uniref:hypothetical protein n=1 Tax=Nocardia sp. CA-107356 TaxID=3239972 RepID=UPI003D8D07EE